jgi:hypothetical protein
MARDKKDKKGKKGKKVDNHNMDELDDNGWVQIEPRSEPPVEEQDERWAYPDWDKRPWISTAGDRRNGEE